MQYIAIILIALVISVGSFAGAYKYLPLSWLEEAPLIGTTLTTIQGSDTLSASRTTINNNFTALNTGKIEISTTTLPLLTTTLALSSVGTITTGTWSGTAIAVAKGGTGTTSPSQWLVLLGNGAAGITHASSTGTSGQFLTSNGAGAYPTWQTSSVNQTDPYNWSGSHNFSSTAYFKYFNASSTLTINGIALSFPPVDGTASSTILATNAAGSLSWVATSSLINFGSIVDTAIKSNSGTASTTFTYKLPANWIGANNVVNIRAIGGGDTGDPKAWDIKLGNGTATTSLAYIVAASLTTQQMRFDVMISNSGSNQTVGTIVFDGYTGALSIKPIVSASYDVTGILYLDFVVKSNTGAANFNGIQITRY